MRIFTYSVKKTTGLPVIGILKHGNYDLTIRWMYLLSTDTLTIIRAQSKRHTLAVARIPSCLGSVLFFSLGTVSWLYGWKRARMRHVQPQTIPRCFRVWNLWSIEEYLIKKTKWFSTCSIQERYEHVNDPELLCRISRRLFNSIATRMLHDTSRNRIKQAPRDTTKQLGTVDVIINQKPCLINEISSRKIFVNVTCYHTHRDTSFNTCFLYGKSQVVSLVTHNTSFTANPSYMTTFPHSTEYSRNMSEIFSIFHCNWNIVSTFLSNIEKYFIATLKF